jgi:hypothetical protein
MSRLATQAELIKLGRTLDVDPERLAFLQDIPAEQLRSMRAATYELMFSQDRELFARVAAFVQRLPARASVHLAERVGPLLTARVAAEVPSARAAAIVLNTSTTFTADVATFLDPRSTHDLIRQLPLERVVAVARELIDRGDYITISRFVEFFADDAVRAVIDEIGEEALLRVAFFMGSKNRLDHLVRLVPQERLEALIRLVADESRDLLSPFVALLVHVSYGLKRELGDLGAAQGEEVLDRIARAAQEQRLWPDVLPVVAAMSPAPRQQVVNLPTLSEPAVQESIIRAADDHRLWGLVLPFVDMMGEPNREAVATIVAGRPRATLANAADAALMGEHWEPLLDLVRRMPVAKQDEFAEIVRTIGDVDPDLLARIVSRADHYGFADRFSEPARPAAV